jgi:hypothetical protein
MVCKSLLKSNFIVMKFLFIFRFVCFIFILAATSCSTQSKISALKPEPSAATSVVYKTTTSIVSMPLEITLTEMENQVNKSLDGLIYEDNNLEEDKTEMKIWKTSRIKISEKNGKIISELPLKIWTKVKYGTDFLGLNDTREINLNGVITLSSEARLNNWKMVTNSKIENFEWSESPTIIVAGKKVPITYIVNPTLSLFKSRMAKAIDEAIEKSCDFKPFVLQVLEKISTPFETNADFETWFRLNPIELYVTDAVLQKSKVIMNLGLKCSMQTVVGAEPKSAFNGSAILLKSVLKIPEKTEATIAAISTYASASRIITKNFKDQVFSSGSRKVIVKNVAIWSKDSKIIVELMTSGSLEGTIYLTGIPNYNALTKEIYFDQMDYVLSTKGLLTNTANWLLQGAILKKIEENCRYSIKENLETANNSMQGYLNNYSPMKGVFINGTLNGFELDKLELFKDAIVAFIKTQGKISVTIDGME